MKSLALALALPVLLLGGPRSGLPQDPEPTPKVYDEAADARVDLAAALARAKKDNKRVLVQWGANWCGWCLKLHQLCKSDRKIARKLMYEYEVVRIDVGDFDKNLELASELGADFKAHGVPYLTVVDAAGKPLVQQDTGVLEVTDEGRHDPDRVLAFLTEHQAPYLEARKVLDAGLEQARATRRRLFVHFGAPW